MNFLFTVRPGSQRRFRASSLVALVALLLSWFGVAPTARAVPNNQLLPRAEDGEGIKVGQRSRFHPGFGLGFGVNSNVFAEDRSENPRTAAFMIATGWLGIGNRDMRDGVLDKPPERSDRLLDYNVGVILGFRQYLDGRKRILQQSRFNLGTELRFSLLPGRRFSVDLTESLYRVAEPVNIEANARFNFNRIDHAGALKFTVRPGGGRVEIAAGYLTEVLYFQESNSAVNNADRTVNGALGEVKWRFFPRSSVFARYTFHHTYYLNCCATPGTGRNEDNYAHRLMGGYRGQVFKKLVLGAELGWGWAFYRQDINGPDFKGPLGQLSLDYFPTLRTRIHLAGFRRFRDSLFGNFFVDIGGRFLFSHIWRWRMITDLGASVMGREYRGIPEPGVEVDNVVQFDGVSGVLNRRDVLVTLLARLEQPLGRLFALRLSYDLMVDQTSFSTLFSSGVRNDAGFIRHLVMLFGAVRY